MATTGLALLWGRGRHEMPCVLGSFQPQKLHSEGSWTVALLPSGSPCLSGPRTVGLWQSLASPTPTRVPGKFVCPSQTLGLGTRFGEMRTCFPDGVGACGWSSDRSAGGTEKIALVAVQKVALGSLRRVAEGLRVGWAQGQKVRKGRQSACLSAHPVRT